MTPFCPNLFGAGIAFGLSVSALACLITAALVSGHMNKKLRAADAKHASRMEDVRLAARKDRDEWREEASRLKQIIIDSTKSLARA